MNKAERAHRDTDIVSNVNIRTNYTDAEDVYISALLWGHIAENIQYASPYWLRQYILECIMDIAYATGSLHYDPRLIFPTGDDASMLKFLLILEFGSEVLALYNNQSKLKEAIERYQQLSFAEVLVG